MATYLCWQHTGTARRYVPDMATYLCWQHTGTGRRYVPDMATYLCWQHTGTGRRYVPDMATYLCWQHTGTGRSSLSWSCLSWRQGWRCWYQRIQLPEPECCQYKSGPLGTHALQTALFHHRCSNPAENQRTPPFSYIQKSIKSPQRSCLHSDLNYR